MASNLRVDSIVPTTSGNVSIGTATGGVTIPGNLGIAGVLTYEDVTNVDSVGVITARSGINVTSGNIALSSNGANVAITTAFDFKIRSNTAKFGLHIDNASGTPTLEFGIGGAQGADITTNSTGPIVFKPNNSERLRITHNGEIGIGGTNYGTSGQFLQSQGSGSAVQWASVSQPDLMADTWRLVTQFINAQTTLGSGGSDWERDDTYGNGLLGTGAASAGMSVSNGYFSFPTTGFYSVKFYGHHSMSYSDGRAISGYIVYTANNFSSSEYATYYTVNCIGNTGQIIHGSSSCEKIFDITNVSNQKFKLAVGYAQNATSGRTTVDSNANRTYVIVTRLGDT